MGPVYGSVYYGTRLRMFWRSILGVASHAAGGCTQDVLSKTSAPTSQITRSQNPED
jgi:hypothetical protein